MLCLGDGMVSPVMFMWVIWDALWSYMWFWNLACPHSELVIYLRAPRLLLLNLSYELDFKASSPFIGFLDLKLQEMTDMLSLSSFVLAYGLSDESLPDYRSNELNTG